MLPVVVLVLNRCQFDGQHITGWVACRTFMIAQTLSIHIALAMSLRELAPPALTPNALANLMLKRSPSKDVDIRSCHPSKRHLSSCSIRLDCHNIGANYLVGDPLS